MRGLRRQLALGRASEIGRDQGDHDGGEDQGAATHARDGRSDGPARSGRAVAGTA